eukprot:7328141-Heterocapsa_arctica.AAC.1
MTRHRAVRRSAAKVDQSGNESSPRMSPKEPLLAEYGKIRCEWSTWITVDMTNNVRRLEANAAILVADGQVL